MENFIGYTLILVGSGILLWSYLSYKKGQESESWATTTTGKVTKSYITDPVRKGTGTVPIVHYEYTLQGKTYKSDRIFWGNTHNRCTIEASQKIVDKYKEGANVTVYYNPKNVRESVLERGAQGIMIWLVACAFLIIIGIIQLFTGFIDNPWG